MWKIFQRRRLVSQGLASPKTRRQIAENPLANELEGGLPAKLAIILAFVVGLAFLIFAGDAEEPLKKFLVCILVFMTAVAQLWINHPNTLASNSRLLLVLGVCFLQLLGVKLILVNAGPQGISPSLAPLFFPYAFAPLVLSVLLGKHHGLYAAIFCSLWGTFLLPAIDPAFLVISLITGFIAVYVTLQVRRRSRLVRAGVYVGLSTWLLAIAFGQVGPVIWESLGATDWRMIGWQSVIAVGTGLATAVIVSGILPALESTFKITTDISWIEMADMNHPLLRRLSLEAPGTYHHSLAVANLSEAAAEAIGANPTVCRVCSYFHDVGKLVKPEYFTENVAPGHNPHEDLTPTMSALIIIAHVKEGVDLALKHKLDPVVIDAIRQHHGTSLVGFFYQRALQQQGDAKLGGKIMNMRTTDIPEVREESFRYPGPKPRSRELAILSLADSVESASRSLERPTAQRIDDLVNDIVDSRIADGQLDECPITLDEIRRVADSLRSTLTSMNHSRIAYPNPRGPKDAKDGRDKDSSEMSAA